MNTQTITMAVAERIADLAPTVADAITDRLVEKESARRVEKIMTALQTLDGDERSAKKLGPDIKAFDANGAIVSEAYSKARLDERNKLHKKIEKTRAAIDAALAGDLSRLDNLNTDKPEAKLKGDDE